MKKSKEVMFSIQKNSMRDLTPTEVTIVAGGTNSITCPFSDPTITSGGPTITTYTTLTTTNTTGQTTGDTRTTTTTFNTIE